MFNRPLAIAWKELLQLRRDRLTLAMMVALPLVQLMLFGYAINTDVRHMPTVVFDQDGTAASRSLAIRMRATGFYDILGEVSGYDEVERALRTGAAKVALIVPPRYGSSITSGRPARVQLVVDGSDPQTVASATNTAAGLVQADAAALVVKRLGAGAGQLIGLETNIWYNPELRTAVYVVPGLVGVILTMTMVMLTSMAIARERERGTLEQLIVSPIKSVELIVGKIVPFIGIGYVQMALILAAGRVVFKVPIIGSLPLLFTLAFVFIAANLAIGLVFSTLAATQQQAMQMSFFFLLPNILLSGFMFPFEAMPRPAQVLSSGLPLTHFLRIVRTITLKGGAFVDVRGELLWLTGLLLFLVALASARFTKKLG
jgi:ABC-2 type transport system permease protein